MAVTDPVNPASQVQPLATSSPLELLGQATASQHKAWLLPKVLLGLGLKPTGQVNKLQVAWQAPLKKGELVVAVMPPVYPLSQVQPLGTSVPWEWAGQATALQPPLKNGEVFVATTEPVKPALQVQPLGRSVPAEPAGHCTAAQLPSPVMVPE